MFIKQLKIEDKYSVIRNLEFKKGLNLIIDQTPVGVPIQTGNNVGKTTVLKLIDFCLGADKKIIYTDPENKKQSYDLVKDYLIENEAVVTLTLTSTFEADDSSDIIIERNFLSKTKCIRKINHAVVPEKDFEGELRKLFVPQLHDEKPTLRQIISHNIRYKDESINNTLKTLSSFTSDVEYESLYLFLLGCHSDYAEKKQLLLAKMSQEKAFKNRLENKQTKTAYELALSSLEDDIASLNDKKAKLNINENFEKDLEQFNFVKYSINKLSSRMSKNKLRKDIIEETLEDIESSKADIDIRQLNDIYSIAKVNISSIQKTFEDLVRYHNDMIVEKAKFIAKDLPKLLQAIAQDELELNSLLAQESELADLIAKSDSFQELEVIISQLNEKFRLKGEYEGIISQLDDVEMILKDCEGQLSEIDEFLFSDSFENKLKAQLKKFNRFFSAISNTLYGEQYLLKYDKVETKTKQQLYKFSAFQANMSSGKKQGEILCFDLAYILFADKEHIPCLHFLLNDKKELLHDNQFAATAKFIKDKNVQLVVSILKDKISSEALNLSHIVVELSQDDKLFRIEK